VEFEVLPALLSTTLLSRWVGGLQVGILLTSSLTMARRALSMPDDIREVEVAILSYLPPSIMPRSAKRWPKDCPVVDFTKQLSRIPEVRPTMTALAGRGPICQTRWPR